MGRYADIDTLLIVHAKYLAIHKRRIFQAGDTTMVRSNEFRGAEASYNQSIGVDVDLASCKESVKTRQHWDPVSRSQFVGLIPWKTLVRYVFKHLTWDNWIIKKSRYRCRLGPLGRSALAGDGISSDPQATLFRFLSKACEDKAVANVHALELTLRTCSDRSHRLGFSLKSVEG